MTAISGSREARAVSAGAPLDRRSEWAAVALNALVVCGTYLDGWAHRHDRVDQSFFTPWHAVLYAGMALFAAFLALIAWRRHTASASCQAALPKAYRLSAAGVALFGLAGLADLGWHTLFGIEADTAALLSPTHLALAAGAVLVVTGPLRELLDAPRDVTASGWGALGPAVLSAALLTAVLAFMTQFAHPFVDWFPLMAAPSARGEADVYAMRADGSEQLRLTTNEHFEGQAAWSPNGGRLVFVASESGIPGGSDLYVMNRDGTGRRRLVATAGEDLTPGWSPDGRSIAFVLLAPPRSARGARPVSDIYVVNADGTGLRRLTGDETSKWGVSWSPDSRRIATSVLGDGSWQITRIEVDGSEQKVLTPVDRGSISPAWSPDGHTIAFQRRERDRNTIYLMNADGTNERPLSIAREAFQPAWAPDGTRLAYAASRDGHTEIYTAPVDGSAETNLTRGSGLDAFQPSWSPDGDSIVYTASAHATPYEQEPIRLGVASILLQVALLLGPLVVLASRFALPRGAYALLIAVALLPALVLQDTYRLVPAVLGAGLAADVLGSSLRPHTSAARLRVFAFAIPATLIAADFGTLRVEAPIEWTVHLWAGAIVLAGVVGLLVALLAGPPAGTSAPE
jgi:Tol biopolymer transport system component